MYQIWTQSSNPRRSYCVFYIWPNNLERRVTCCTHAIGSGILFTKFNFRQLAWITVFYADTLRHVVTLTFNPLTLKVCGTSSVTLSKYVRNLSEIEQFPAELLIILRILHMLCHAVTLTFDLLALNFYSTSGVMRLNFLQNLSEIERPSYRRFSAFSRAILGGGSQLTELSQGCVDPTSPNLAKT